MRWAPSSGLTKLLVCAAICPLVLLAFAHAQVGSVIENAELPTLDGGRHFFLTNAAANVFLFVKPGQEHSDETLRQLAVLEKENEGKSVHWVAIVSDKISQTTVRTAVTAAGIKMPVLIDTGDALYGRLGVVLYPCIGITDKQHVLMNYEHFTKINYNEVVRARIRFLLQEITTQELDAALKPATATMPTNDLALRHLNFSRKLFNTKRYDPAASQAKTSIEHDPKLAAAHTLLGEILYAQGNKAEALKAFEKALQLDASDAKAAAGKKACSE